MAVNGTTGGRGRGSTLENWLPLAYFIAALLLVVAILPTVLRQPPPEQNQTAELSPDAPPDENQESIVASLRSASSATAGTGDAEGPSDIDGPGGPEVGPGGAGVGPAKACPRGVGNPPRQTFSLYAAPCAPRFEGDNGGATSKGVTGTEVRVVISVPSQQIGTEGPVATEPKPGESANDRTWRVLQAWFNANYQFYGRQLRLYVVPGAEAAEGQRTAATKADVEAKAFAAVMGRAVAVDELTRRKIVAFGVVQDEYPAKFLADRAPYVYTVEMDTDRMMEITSEFVCKKLAPGPARFAGDAGMQAQPRRYGLVGYSLTGERVGGNIGRHLKACGIDLAAEVYLEGGSNDSQNLATAVTSLRSAGVTTVIDAVDWASTAGITAQAQSQNWSPEWVVSGFNTVDWNSMGRLFSQAQWAHAMGVSSREIERSEVETDFYKAYKEIEPSGAPNQANAERVWAALEQIANGIQQAGPKLTPETFRQGLFSIGHREPKPRWSVGGGFGPGDLAYSDYVGEMWWDPLATDATGNVGAYRFVADGQRFKLGQLTTDTSELFKSGTPVPPPD